MKIFVSCSPKVRILINCSTWLIYFICVGSESWCSNNVIVCLTVLEEKCSKYCWVTHCPPPHNSWQIVGSPHLHRWFSGWPGDEQSGLHFFVTTSQALWQPVRGTFPRLCLLCLAIAYKAGTEDGWVGSEVSLSHSNISPRMAHSHKQTTHSCLCAPYSTGVVTTQCWVFSHTTTVTTVFFLTIKISTHVTEGHIIDSLYKYYLIALVVLIC